MRKRWGSTLSLVLFIILIVSIEHSAHAQSAGSTTISLGWAHISPVSSSDPLTITSIGGQPANMTQPGTGSVALSSDTVGMLLEHYFTDHIGVATLAGFPVYLNLEGTGTFAKYGVIGKGRPWAPQVILTYHLFSAESKFRPFAGVGVSYTWFTNAHVTNTAFITQSFGPGGSASASASSSWNPVFAAGANYRFSKHWMAGFSLLYIPASTNLTLTGRTATGTEIVSKTTVRLRPIITFVNASYVF